jgi:hypothetical protein
MVQSIILNLILTLPILAQAQSPVPRSKVIAPSVTLPAATFVSLSTPIRARIKMSSRKSAMAVPRDFERRGLLRKDVELRE